MRKKVILAVLVIVAAVCAGCWLRWEKFEWSDRKEELPGVEAPEGGAGGE